MTSRRPGAASVLRVLFVLSPVLVPALLVLGLVVAFLLLMVVQAFGEGFAVGCAALAALIGLPSIGLLWLSAAIRVLGPKPIPAPVPTAPRRPLESDIAARYRSGDFIHRDYEAEQRERTGE